MKHKEHLTTDEKIAQGLKYDQVVLRVPILLKKRIEQENEKMNPMCVGFIAKALGYDYVPERSKKTPKYPSLEAKKEAAKVAAKTAREHVKDIKALMADTDAASAIKALMASLAAKKAK